MMLHDLGQDRLQAEFLDPRTNQVNHDPTRDATESQVSGPPSEAGDNSGSGVRCYS